MRWLLSLTLKIIANYLHFFRAAGIVITTGKAEKDLTKLKLTNVFFSVFFQDSSVLWSFFIFLTLRLGFLLYSKNETM